MKPWSTSAATSSAEPGSGPSSIFDAFSRTAARNSTLLPWLCATTCSGLPVRLRADSVLASGVSLFSPLRTMES